MKKYIAILLVAAMATLGISACRKENSNKETKVQKDSDIKVVTTIFPEYDWVRQIAGKEADQMDITMLLDNGVDLHSYQPTAEDIMKVSDCDLFVYVGGESDAWVDDALKQAKNKDMQVVNLLDVLGNSAKEEEVIEGMEPEEEEEGGKTKIKFAPLAVFCTFFVAELGDKTQLTAITFGANEGMRAALVVWIGCSLGLFAADMLGMLIGYLLKSKTPDGLLSMLAFAIFSIFGVYTLYQGLKLVCASVCPIPVIPVLVVVTIAFAGLCAFLFIRREKKKKAP